MPVVLAIAAPPALLLLLGLPFGVVYNFLRARLGMMHRAGWLRAYHTQLAFVHALGDDGFGGVFARLVFRSCCLFFGRGLLRPDFNVLVARQRGAAFLLLSIGCADLHELGFRGDGLS